MGKVASSGADVFAIRGLASLRPGKPDLRWEGDELVFAYDGSDGVHRELRVKISGTLARREGASITFGIALEPHDSCRISLDYVVREYHPAKERKRARRVAGDSESLLERAVDRGLRDLRTLRTTLDQDRFFAAGVPWFATLFGRDSLVCSLQTLAYRPEIAAQTLRLLARWCADSCKTTFLAAGGFAPSVVEKRHTTRSGITSEPCGPTTTRSSRRIRQTRLPGGGL